MREAFGLQGAWITNGLDSARYSAGDFERLSAWQYKPYRAAHVAGPSTATYLESRLTLAANTDDDKPANAR
jgi:hypothetical protein